MRTTVTPTASPGNRPSPIAPGRIGSTSPRAWWGDRGVRTKVLAAVAVASLVAVLIGVMGISALGTSAHTSRMLYTENINGLTSAADMRTLVADVRVASLLGHVHMLEAVRAAADDGHDRLVAFCEATVRLRDHCIGVRQQVRSGKERSSPMPSSSP